MSIELFKNQQKQKKLKTQIRQLDLYCAHLIKAHASNPVNSRELKDSALALKSALNQLSTLQTERKALLSRPSAYYLKALTSPLYLLLFALMVISWGLWVT